ncbi:hypothetical protein Ancab_010385 [Ancistrocladus abbreviatus]
MQIFQLFDTNEGLGNCWGGTTAEFCVLRYSVMFFLLGGDHIEGGFITEVFNQATKSREGGAEHGLVNSATIRMKSD